MADSEIHESITQLVDREHALRASLEGHDDPAARAELEGIEVQLDRLWDLLRQRRARREFGENPGSAQERPASEVEGYRG